ncbi:hypothetical protein DFH06DRAFT_1214602 [Mycena polygramma]|nr:hypothetical protein DFH06DRAFT_1214602 [Mycena polygramma]
MEALVDLELAGDSSDQGYDSDASLATVSSYNESDNPRPDVPFSPMPAHLALPLKLQYLILSEEDTAHDLMWGSYRLVCKAWKERVEHLAKSQWVPDSCITYLASVKRAPGESRIYGAFTFQRFADDETAIFAILHTPSDCVEPLIKACKAATPPEVEVYYIVHDVEIPGMVVDWDTLTLTCPWRSLIACVLAEELKVRAHRSANLKTLLSKGKRLQRSGADLLSSIELIAHMFAEHVGNAYSAVRTARRGVRDKKGDKRLHEARLQAEHKWLFPEGEEDS